jgi:hypothetical protein
MYPWCAVRSFPAHAVKKQKTDPRPDSEIFQKWKSDRRISVAYAKIVERVTVISIDHLPRVFADLSHPPPDQLMTLALKSVTQTLLSTRQLRVVANAGARKRVPS